jgi:D-alanine-D-alanine ligase
LGSSIGITVANNEEEAKKGIEKCFELDDRLIVEKYLKEKKDINCAVYLRKGEICVSEPEEAFGEGIYSFEEKYVKRNSDGGNFMKGGGRYEITGEIREKIRSYSRTIYKRMDIRGVVRMDFLVNEGKVYLCEVNTVPGSLAYYLFCERITDGRGFISDLIEEAFSPNGEKKKILSTGILKKVHFSRK